MRVFTSLILLALGLTITHSGFAKIYKWTDANGKTHYTATPPPSKTKVLSNTEFKVRKTPKSSLTHTTSESKYTSNHKSKKTAKTVTDKRQHARAQCQKARQKAPALEREVQRQLRRAVKSGKIPKEKMAEFKRQQNAGKFKAPSMSACVKNYMSGGSRQTDTIADNSASDAVLNIQLDNAFGF